MSSLAIRTLIALGITVVFILVIERFISGRKHQEPEQAPPVPAEPKAEPHDTSRTA